MYTKTFEFYMIICMEIPLPSIQMKSWKSKWHNKYKQPQIYFFWDKNGKRDGQPKYKCILDLLDIYTVVGTFYSVSKS